MNPDDRPDPLAELPPRPKPGTPPPGPDLSVCSQFVTTTARCSTPPAVIFWMGCLRGEHAGPLPYCAHHATPRIKRTCAQCGGDVRVLMITSMDGHTTVAVPDEGGEPPPHLWQQVFPAEP